jgi:hypothetical protein
MSNALSLLVWSVGVIAWIVSAVTLSVNARSLPPLARPPEPQSRSLFLLRLPWYQLLRTLAFAKESLRDRSHPRHWTVLAQIVSMVCFLVAFLLLVFLMRSPGATQGR